MNFLALCKRLRSEAGIAGSGPVSTAAQTGELLRVVDWINDAYVDIQDKRIDWNFLREDFSFDTVASTGEYSKSSVSNLADWKKNSFRCYLKSNGVQDEDYLTYEDWECFRNQRLFGSNRSAEGRPLYFSIKPDKSVVLWPVPSDVYTIVGEYYRTAYELSGDSDVPIFDRHHMAIVYNALMRYAAYVSEPALYAKAEREYNRLVNKLEATYTQGIKLAGAMA